MTYILVLYSRVTLLTLLPVEAPKIGSTTRGIPAWFGPWLVAPYPFGIAGPTRDNGTSFPIYECVCVEFDVAALTVPI